MTPPLIERFPLGVRCRDPESKEQTFYPTIMERTSLQHWSPLTFTLLYPTFKDRVSTGTSLSDKDPDPGVEVSRVECCRNTHLSRRFLPKPPTYLGCLTRTQSEPEEGGGQWELRSKDSHESSSFFLFVRTTQPSSLLRMW